MPDELESFEQCWLTGTAAEVTPVGQIGDYRFEVGQMTRDIAQAYEALVRALMPPRNPRGRHARGRGDLKRTAPDTAATALTHAPRVGVRH